MKTAFSDHERQVLYTLIEEITGTHQSGLDRKDFLARNVMDLMTTEGVEEFSAFLETLDNNESLYQKFVSAITIHTTSWFREPEHFSELKSWVERGLKNGPLFLELVSVACSSGQEVYSLGLTLETLRRQHPKFDYKILGVDIDALCIENARRAVYPGTQLKEIPSEYHQLCLTKDGPSGGWMTLDPEITRRCTFQEKNLLDWAGDSSLSPVDVIFCRNVLIYFHPRRVTQIIQSLSNHLRNEGLLILGQREASSHRFPNLSCIAPAIFELRQKSTPAKPCALVIDDVAPLRSLIRSSLAKVGFDVIEASSAEEASRILLDRNIDLVTLDLDLPGENGASWLKRLRNGGLLTPVVIVSGSTSEEAREVYGLIEHGASEHFVKETLSRNLDRLGQLARALTQNESSSISSQLRFASSLGSFEALQILRRPEVILIGASTGGPNAIWQLLSGLKTTPPPLVIVQHTSESFLKPFAEKCSEKTGLALGATPGALQEGRIYLAQTDQHIVLHRNSRGHLEIRHSDEGPHNGHRPSVDRLFETAAQAGVRAAAFLLTGMGTDGAIGMKALLDQTQSVNFAQSRESCAVFGMPQEAIRLGAVHEVGDLSLLRQRLEGLIHG